VARAPDHRPRLTGGQARGRPLAVPVPAGVRPTASRVREALFSIVGQHLDGQRVLDAFGGSGLLGFEAWSRGAAVVVIELDPAVGDAIRRNAAALGSDLEVVAGDALRVAAGLGPFDLGLVDPPYRLDPLPVLRALSGVPSPLFVLEHDAGGAAPEVPGLRRERTRSYGAGALTVYHRGEGP
jgi:16S rRNA (guanine966-N2)-methyltransferase